ncbi:MAG: type II toxin-antitoxin system RatA family toxin [Candidatus Symbiobacter sp.]|nr:type II toxin-antitoxin system RatA family toxin [Candidatus Symbiobacter sp.]
MPSHREQKLLPYAPAQIFALVADIEQYPQFLPWCLAARVKSRGPAPDSGEWLLADLVIGYKLIRESYTSRVILNPPRVIEVTYTQGPFKSLHNLWRFSEHDGHCQVDFALDFEFKSGFLQKMIEPFFADAVRRMVAAFELRADKILGQASMTPPSCLGKV